MAPILTLLERRGWSIERKSLKEPLLGEDLSAQFSQLPCDLLEFLGQLEVCANAAETVWFLTASDFRNTEPGSFRWNEYKHIALEGADSPEAVAAIDNFWSAHFPFALSVHSDYDYLAVKVGGPESGSVVHGYAPFWEEPSVIAPSFGNFLILYAQAAESEIPEYPYSFFL